MKKSEKKKKTIKTTCSNCDKNFFVKESLLKKVKLENSMWRCRKCGAYNYF